ncbi:MAG: DJ-1/PfpI family protein, partial [Acidobacteriota bacterium]|nr:DJ-1/PfpI family protein [Acidobacteriota bacterium]
SMGADLEDEEMIAWVRETGEQADFVVSLCDGAFVLAAAGLLDGHTATTFPGDQDRFAEMFPAIELERESSFVQDDRVLTSQGGAKSYDVAMHLVDLLYGEEVAAGVGRGLIIPWPPQ